MKGNRHHSFHPTKSQQVRGMQAKHVPDVREQRKTKHTPVELQQNEGELNQLQAAVLLVAAADTQYAAQSGGSILLASLILSFLIKRAFGESETPRDAHALRR